MISDSLLRPLADTGLKLGSVIDAIPTMVVETRPHRPSQTVLPLAYLGPTYLRMSTARSLEPL